MKVLAIVQARMGSQRLPGKVMKKINGKPMISYTLEALRKSKYIDKIVLATSTLKVNDTLAAYVESEGIDVFRGDEDNVLKRYKMVADKYNGDIIIRITGDCPLIDPIIVDNVITKYLMYDYDYVRLDVPNSFVRGMDTEVFSKNALDKTYDIVCNNENMQKEEYNSFREHVTLYIYNNQDKFKVGYVKGEGKYYEAKETNYSVDEEDDFERVKRKLDEIN